MYMVCLCCFLILYRTILDARLEAREREGDKFDRTPILVWAVSGENEIEQGGQVSHLKGSDGLRKAVPCSRTAFQLSVTKRSAQTAAWAQWPGLAEGAGSGRPGGQGVDGELGRWASLEPARARAWRLTRRPRDPGGTGRRN